jgi:hypothetical protein
MKIHKEILKNISSSSNEKIKINTFHIDFIKTCIYYYSSLVTNYELKIKPCKLCKQLVDILMNLNSNFEFEVNYYNQFKLNKITDETESTEQDNENETNNVEKLKVVLIKTISLSTRKLETDDFVSFLEYFESIINSSNLNSLTRLVEFIRYISCEIELNDDLKSKLSEFIQKLLIQLQPLYISLKMNGKFDEIITLLNCQTCITSSKYVTIIGKNDKNLKISFFFQF